MAFQELSDLETDILVSTDAYHSFTLQTLRACRNGKETVHCVSGTDETSPVSVVSDALCPVDLQTLQACRNGKETVRVAFRELNDGGLMARFLGLRLFMPLSHLARPEPGKFMNHEVSSTRWRRARSFVPGFH